MGLPKQAIKLLKNENEYKKIKGEVLFCGKQTILVNKEMMGKIFEDDLKFRKLILDKWDDPKSLDNSTRHRQETLKDKVFIETYCDVNFNCVDISDYEGANIICDLNHPIPENLKNRFDFIFSGGCFDNVFNPVSLLVNTSEMLKPGGRVMHYETFVAVPGFYLSFSPEWFYSYYAINNFIDCKVYVCHQTEKGETRTLYDTNLFEYKPEFTRRIDYDYFDAALACAGIMYVMVIAEKGADSTHDLMPTQMQYLDEKSIDWRLAATQFDKTNRPILSSRVKNNDYKLPFLTDHYRYLGSKY
jgi:SAM-dependent methyltransferase